MICRCCERDLPEAEFYRKPGGLMANPDCKLCYRDKQSVRASKRGKIVDPRDIPHPMDGFLRRSA